MLIRLTLAGKRCYSLPIPIAGGVTLKVSFPPHCAWVHPFRVNHVSSPSSLMVCSLIKLHSNIKREILHRLRVIPAPHSCRYAPPHSAHPGGRRELGVRGRELRLPSRPVPISWTGKVRSGCPLMDGGPTRARWMFGHAASHWWRFAPRRRRVMPWSGSASSAAVGRLRSHPSQITASLPRFPGIRASL